MDPHTGALIRAILHDTPLAERWELLGDLLPIAFRYRYVRADRQPHYSDEAVLYRGDTLHFDDDVGPIISLLWEKPGHTAQISFLREFVDGPWTGRTVDWDALEREPR